MWVFAKKEGGNIIMVSRYRRPVAANGVVNSWWNISDEAIVKCDLHHTEWNQEPVVSAIPVSSGWFIITAYASFSCISDRRGS